MNLPIDSLGRLAWGRTLLQRTRPTPNRNALRLASFVLALKDRFAPSRARPVPLDASRPRLAPPKPPTIGSFRPPRYFSKGSSKTELEPIRYLLTESLELPVARPVPDNSSLIRSLCKGKGTLKQNEEGLTYLDVDNHFISAMMPYLKRQGLIQPPYFNVFGPSVGAHVPVIPKREADFHYLAPIKELTHEFSFEIEGLYSLRPDTWPEVKEVWFFKIRSPELEALRRRYFLTERPLGHSFHIAVAIQPREGASSESAPTPLMRINIAFLAA
jgi:hypothetical protein